MKIQATTRRSYRRAAGVLARAFLAEPVSQAIYSGLTPEQQLRNLTLDFTGELVICLRRGEPLELWQGERLAAVAAIYPPGTLPLPRLAQFYISITSIWGHAHYDYRRWTEWLEEVSKLHPDRPHYYLEFLGVEPALQGQGLGSRLLGELTRRADAAGTGCYLETASQRNIPLYQRFGFEVSAHKEVIGLPAWFMWRPGK
jgi:GNAT superfamily N-acetyltransferase